MTCMQQLEGGAVTELIEFVRYYATCPCCQKSDVCKAECTYQTDSPDGHAEMLHAREVYARAVKQLEQIP